MLIIPNRFPIIIYYLMVMIWITEGWSAIIQINDFKELQHIVLKADQDTLVIFDVDNVLIHPKDHILKERNKLYCESIVYALNARLTLSEAKIYQSIAWLQRYNEPVEPKMIQLIQELQNRNIRVLALTNCITGKHGYIEAVEDWRINELTQFNYHFDYSWPKLEEKFFKTFISKENDSFPLFKHGILFTNRHSKGDILKLFLEYAHYHPHKIIFIDDNKSYLESVQKVASELNTEFTGVHYTFVYDTPLEPLNEKRAALQFEILEKEKIWLSDHQADSYLKKV